MALEQARCMNRQEYRRQPYQQIPPHLREVLTRNYLKYFHKFILIFLFNFKFLFDKLRFEWAISSLL